jgi:P27 family predicted phage terminase small subunit
MGLRGKVGKSAAELRASGAYRADRHSNRGESMTFRPGLPGCPSFLSQEARDEWRRVVKVLAAAGLLTVADRASLTAYCEAWGEFAELVRRLQDLPADAPQAGRLRRQKNKAADGLLKSGDKFGFSPAGRVRLGIKVKEPDRTDRLDLKFFQHS